jgi:hypothetical protein
MHVSSHMVYTYLSWYVIEVLVLIDKIPDISKFACIIYVFIEIKIFWPKKTTTPSIFLECENRHNIAEILPMLMLSTNQSIERVNGLINLLENIICNNYAISMEIVLNHKIYKTHYLSWYVIEVLVLIDKIPDISKFACISQNICGVVVVVIPW